jgi:hypothetical protein
MPRKPKKTAPAPRPRTSQAATEHGRRMLRAIDLLRRPQTRAELAVALGIPDRTCNDLLETMVGIGYPVLSERAGRVIVYQVKDPAWLGIARTVTSLYPPVTRAKC